MKKLIIALLFVVLVFGCNKHAGPAQFCADHVHMDFLNMDYDDPGMCYTRAGVLRVIVYNTGDVPIESFLLRVNGNSSLVQVDIAQYVSTTDAIPLDILFPGKEVGQVDSIVLVPRAKYENRTVSCEGSMRFVRALKLCDDVRSYG